MTGNSNINPVVNIDDLEFMDLSQGNKFEAKLGQIGAKIGLEKLGCMLTVVPAGKTAFPFHVHHANDELFIILEGEGEYRFGSDIHPLKAGDIVSAPAGGPEFAHQIINTGKSQMKYIAVSTKNQPEVVEYPDSDKFGIISRMEGGSPMSAKFRHFGRHENNIDYWDQET